MSAREAMPEFRITPVNSGYYTLQIYPRVYVNMFRVKPRVTLGLIFFTVLIQNSDKQWQVLSGCLKKLPSGIPSGHQTFPRGCAPRESLMTLENSLGQLFPNNHSGHSTVYTRVAESWDPGIQDPTIFEQAACRLNHSKVTRKPQLLDELTSFVQRESSPIILGLY